MIFNPSPALHKIRQLVQLFRRHPVPSRPSRYTPWPDQDLSGPDLSGPDLPGDDLSRQDLPDPEQFIDTSVKKTAAMSDPSGSHTRRKRASSLGRIAR
jgi:hypothetical protein